MLLGLGSGKKTCSRSEGAHACSELPMTVPDAVLPLPVHEQLVRREHAGLPNFSAATTWHPRSVAISIHREPTYSGHVERAASVASSVPATFF